MKTINLSQSKHAIVSDRDYQKISQYKWYAIRSVKDIFYPATKIEGKNIRMHRFLLEPKDKEIVDHINGNTLDNRRSNLRICSQQQNNFNQKPFGRSKYKGVSWQKHAKKWKAQIQFNRKRKSIGYFDKAENAAKAYNLWADKLFGEFAYLNRIKELK